MSGVVKREPVVDVELRLAEEQVTARILEREERTLDGTDAGRADVAIRRAIRGRVLSHARHHGPEVLEVDQGEALVACHMEDDRQDARLDVGEAEDAREQGRTHLGHGGAHGRALLAIDVPEAGGTAMEVHVVHAEVVKTGRELGGCLPRDGDARDVALHVGQEARDTRVRQARGDGLERDRLARTRGTRDEAVTVAHGGKQAQVRVGVGYDELVG
jgi:hypothetical protein